MGLIILMKFRKSLEVRIRGDIDNSMPPQNDSDRPDLGPLFLRVKTWNTSVDIGFQQKRFGDHFK